MLLSTETVIFQDEMPQGSRSTLSTPETVHLAVTYRCEENCLDCYVQWKTRFREANTEGMLAIVDNIADHGVFQLAIGGGEPFARNDLEAIARHAACRGLVVHITTGRYDLDASQMRVLQHIQSLHIGIRSESLIHDEDVVAAKLRVLSECASGVGVALGANLILTRFTVQHLEKSVELLMLCGFRRLIFVRYKPIADLTRWHAEQPHAKDYQALTHRLSEIKSRFPALSLRVDCAASFLMHDTPIHDAEKAGMRGCVAGERIISVAPDGSVYPCSQLVGDGYLAGNLTEDSLGKIWHESDALHQYRHFRQSATFSHSVCGQCSAATFCGGCRIFAQDTIGGEKTCPLGH